MSKVGQSAAQAQQREIQAKQRHGQVELKKLSERQDRELRASKDAHQADMVNLREQNHQQVAEEVRKKEETLMTLRDSLEKTKQVTDNEAKRLEALGVQRRAQIAERQRHEQELLTQRNEEQLQDQNHHFNVALRDQVENQRREAKGLEDMHRQEMANQQGLWKGKIHQQRANFSELHAKEGQRFEQMHHTQERNQKSEALTLHRQHQERMGEMSDRQTKEQGKLTEHHQTNLHDRERFFEKKYQAQMQIHEGYTKELEARNEKAQAASRESLFKRVSADEVRSGDPFFAFTDLKPEVREIPEGYEVKVKVPDYAKEEVLLSANTKELVLTFNRRHKDERKTADGGSERIDRVESTVNRIPVGSPLDPRKMTRTWEDGTLTFVVKKA